MIERRLGDMNVSCEKMRKVNRAPVLIFNPYTCNVTDGGPSGVIAQNLLNQPSKLYDLTPVFNYEITTLALIEKLLIQTPVPRYYIDWYKKCRSIFRRFDVGRYSILFFHDVFSLACCLDLIKPKQHVILQSHSPELPHEEISESAVATDEIVKWVRKAEFDAFARADSVVFPNEGAADIYLPLLRNSSRRVFLPTGAKGAPDFRKVCLDPSLFYLLFIGRRNRIKGFDIVIDAFRCAYQCRPELRLVLVGRGEPVYDSGVIDIGFSDSAHIWINSCDFVVNCNRQSYFDLSILETLSVGTPLLVSANQGHSEFAATGSRGIINIGYPDAQSLVAVLLQDDLKNLSGTEARKDNQLLYKTKYTDAIYRNNLNEMLLQILYDIEPKSRYSALIEN